MIHMCNLFGISTCLCFSGYLRIIGFVYGLAMRNTDATTVAIIINIIILIIIIVIITPESGAHPHSVAHHHDVRSPWRRFFVRPVCALLVVWRRRR